MLKTFYFNELRTACHILSDETKQCAIIDPGCCSENEQERLVKYVEENGLIPKMVINTHGHFDHIFSDKFASEKWGIPVYLNHSDLNGFRKAQFYGGYFGYTIDLPEQDPTDIKDGDIIAFGDTRLTAMATPGHSKGSVVLYNEKEGYLISGDTLFANSIGRTDLPEGDYDVICESLHRIFATYPDDTKVYPGHGGATTIGDERLKNPFIVEMGI